MVVNLFTFGQCRIGEAKTPGPSQAQPCPTWSLGICNSSGLQGKSVLLADIDADVIAVSETHLTAVSRSMLSQSLRSHSQYHAVVTGAPMAARSFCNDAGAYSGVATIAKVPSRALPVPWPPDLFETGRVQVTGSLISNFWVTGAIMYGYPQGFIRMLWNVLSTCWTFL